MSLDALFRWLAPMCNADFCPSCTDPECECWCHEALIDEDYEPWDEADQRRSEIEEDTRARRRADA
jgi:hypothetical protein